MLTLDINDSAIKVKNVREVFDGTTTKRQWKCVDCKVWIDDSDTRPELVGEVLVIMCKNCND